MKFYIFAFLLLVLGTTFADGVISECTVIDEEDGPGVYNLSNNISGVGVGPGAQACIYVNISDVTIDCLNLYKLNHTDSGYGVYVDTANNVTVQNCNIEGYGFGIRFLYSAFGSIRNNYLDTNTVDGIYLTDSSFNTIDNNYLVSHSGGILLDAVEPLSYNNISNNYILSNAGTAFYIADDNNLFINNTIENAAIGFYVVADEEWEHGYNNTFVNNTVFDCMGGGEEGSFGFYLYRTDWNTLIQNNASNCGYGFLVEGDYYTSYNDLIGNIAHDNNVGFLILYTDNEYLQDNLAYNNYHAGFIVESSYLITLVNNTARNNPPIPDPEYCYQLELFKTEFPIFPSGFMTVYSWVVNFTGNTAHDNYCGEGGEGAGAAGFLFFGNSGDVNLSSALAHGNDVGVLSLGGVNDTMDCAYSVVQPAIYDSWFYNNVYSTIGFCVDDVLIQNTRYGYSPYMSISLLASHFDLYAINDSLWEIPSSNLTSFRSKYLWLGADNETSFDIIFHWSNQESNGYDESSMVSLLCQYEGGDCWEEFEQELDTENNTISSFLLMPAFWNVFGLFADEQSNNNDPSPSDPELSIELVSDCEENTVTVTSGSDPVENAEVKVNGDIIGKTDENGEIQFDGCGQLAIIRASKSGYDSATLKQDLDDCDCVETPGLTLECYVNADCLSDEVCQQNECTPITCECGYIESHACVAYGCCEDLDCSADQYCSDNVCMDQEQPECTLDSDCSDGYICTDETCVPDPSEAEQAIEEAESAIASAKASGKNTTEAEGLLGQAEQEYEAGNYEEAESLANQAIAAANSASAPPTTPTDNQTTTSPAVVEEDKGIDCVSTAFVLALVGLVVGGAYYFTKKPVPKYKK
ncbi:MAG: NosD domain-containing protein [Candidatus Micrarchaeota archaeon]